MAHAHSQTLLKRLGFQDPDRQNPLHDLACFYVKQNVCQFVDSKWDITHSRMEFHVKGCFMDIVAFGSHGKSQFAGSLTGAVVLEVKIDRVPVGDVLKQLNLYTDKLRNERSLWYGMPLIHRVLAPMYDYTDTELRILQSEGVSVIRLDELEVRKGA